MIHLVMFDREWVDGEEVASVWRMVRDGERTPQSPQLQVELTCAHQPTIVSVGPPSYMYIICELCWKSQY